MHAHIHLGIYNNGLILRAILFRFQHRNIAQDAIDTIIYLQSSLAVGLSTDIEFEFHDIAATITVFFFS